MTSTVLRSSIAGAVALGAVTLHAMPAAASIFAQDTLFNNTLCPISITPSSGPGGGNWDPAPPTLVAPGQTIFWGSVDDGGLFSGTGGTVQIPLDTGVGDLKWSVPFSYFHGLGGSATGSTDNVSGSAFTLLGGATGCSGDGP